MLKRTRIREVVPEVISPNGGPPKEADEAVQAPLAVAELEPEVAAEPSLRSVGPDRDADLDEALARAEAAQREAEEAEARAAAARAEAARLEAALAETARALAQAKAARKEAGREEATRLEAARLLEADLEQTRLEAKELEETLLEAARTDFAAEPAQEVEPLRPDVAAEAPVATSVATEAPPAPVTTSVASEAPPAQETALQTCEVRFWRGYRKSAFYARTIHEGEELAVAESPFFRARGNGIPEPTAEAEAAYAKLREQLERGGWTVIEPGSNWFDATFGRELTGAAAPAPE